MDKEHLKELRESRKEPVAAAKEQMKKQKAALRAIREALQKGPLTIPEIAAAIQFPTAETLWYIAAMKKYGHVKEDEKSGGYFKYALAES